MKAWLRGDDIHTDQDEEVSPYNKWHSFFFSPELGIYWKIRQKPNKRDQNNSFIIDKWCIREYNLICGQMDIFFTLHNGFTLAFKTAGVPFARMGLANMYGSRTQCPLCVRQAVLERSTAHKRFPKLASHWLTHPPIRKCGKWMRKEAKREYKVPHKNVRQEKVRSPLATSSVKKGEGVNHNWWRERTAL